MYFMLVLTVSRPKRFYLEARDNLGKRELSTPKISPSEYWQRWFDGVQNKRAVWWDAGTLSLRMTSIQTVETGYLPRLPRLPMPPFKRHWVAGIEKISGIIPNELTCWIKLKWFLLESTASPIQPEPINQVNFTPSREPFQRLCFHYGAYWLSLKARMTSSSS